MDWAKAKTILILILLVVCLILGGILISRNLEEVHAAEASRVAAAEYLESIGVKLNVAIPKERPALEVLFLQHTESSTQLKNGKYLVYSNAMSNIGYKITEHGKSKAKVISASSALLQMATSLDSPKGLEIDQIELCYYVDNKEFKPAETNTDTAIPAWRIDSSNGVYYILAY